MSLRIIKTGLLDTVQDHGRYGFQHLGINPSGCMDLFSFRLANSLLGNDLNTPILEMHFPASEILFEQGTIFCLTGAEFSAHLDDIAIPLNQPVITPKNSTLKFKRRLTGERCYLAVLKGFRIPGWLGSNSTNLKAGAGGYEGRKLMKGDVLNFGEREEYNNLSERIAFKILPWRVEGLKIEHTIRFMKGNEWNWLNKGSEKVLKQEFHIRKESDRMAFRLTGASLKASDNIMISSAVVFGTIQLLPDGQLIVLMADHQTTGGYPAIGHVISADLPSLAQLSPGDKISFTAVDTETAYSEYKDQLTYLSALQSACRFKMDMYDSL